MPVEVSAELSGGYPIEQVDRLVRQLQPLIELSEPARVVLRLERLVHLCPAALALLTAVAFRLMQRNLLEEGSTVTTPRSWLTANYLQRMDFIRLLTQQEGDEPFERREDFGFRPVRMLTGETRYHAVCADLVTALAERIPADRATLFSLRIALDEIAENVVHHAESPIGGFAAAQGYPRKRKFEIAIVDMGIGIRASLAKNPAYADTASDLDAIELALQKYVTATPERNAGTGLFVTKLLMEANGGVLAVRSGNGAVYSGVEGKALQRETPFPGTMVALRARTDTTLDINEIFAREFPEDLED
jgi:anti-sigma regulatory factor (Ser/Thr protein kinase)